MGISAMWNAISLVQDLNACRRVHFLRRVGVFAFSKYTHPDRILAA